MEITITDNESFTFDQPMRILRLQFIRASRETTLAKILHPWGHLLREFNCSTNEPFAKPGLNPDLLPLWPKGTYKVSGMLPEDRLILTFHEQPKPPLTPVIDERERERLQELWWREHHPLMVPPNQKNDWEVRLIP